MDIKNKYLPSYLAANKKILALLGFIASYEKGNQNIDRGVTYFSDGSGNKIFIIKIINKFFDIIYNFKLSLIQIINKTQVLENFI